MRANSASTTQEKPERCCARLPRAGAQDTRAYAGLLKAIADETRLAIVGLLAAADGALCVCDVEARVGHLSQPTISHHLKQLREAGLVTSERRGTWVYYALDKGAIARLREFVDLLER